jgi:hypothetical protein
MIRKIKDWLYARKIYGSDINTIVGPATVQEDTNTAKARVRRAFQEQRLQIDMRALVAHHCKEPDLCSKTDCWKFVPDKIVKTSVVKIPKKRRTHVSMGNYKTD